MGTWSKLSLDYVPHKDTEMNVIKPSEEVPQPHTHIYRQIDIDTYKALLATCALLAL